MAGIKETITGVIPEGVLPSFTLGGVVSFIAWLVVFIIIIGLMTGFLIWFILNRKYNMKIIIYEKIGSSFVPTRTDKGTLVRLSTAGDTITYLKKEKKYLANPTIQMGNRVYWFFIREDGEWINFGLDDLDGLSKKVGAKFLDKEMRAWRTAIQKGLKDRYDAPSFMQKYGAYVIAFSFLGLLIVGTWLLWDKWLELATTTNSGVELSGQVTEKIGNLLTAMDNLCSGGSGIRPA